MSVKVSLSSVTLSSDDEIAFKQNGMTLIVGPNNSGKSSFLREIFQTLQIGSEPSKKSRKIISQIKFIQEGDQILIQQFLNSNTKQFNDPNGLTFLRTLNVNVQENTAIARWQNLDNGLHETTSLYCTFVDTMSRLSITNPPQTLDVLSDIPQHPIHVLYEDDSVENQLSEYIQLAFGENLILNRGAGSIIPLHFGKAPEKKSGEDRVSKGYLKELADIPKIHEQGDGIKSFIGCLLQTIIMKKFITLLDEPEAFLHPPQAKLLGLLLAREHPNNQLIVSTHSGDIVRGILETDISNLTIVRITRKGNKNYASKLAAEDIQKLWADPILKFSNILDGLFHEGIIVCEADADCRFYSAMMDTLYERNIKEKDAEEAKSNNAKKKPDILFTSCGGKDRIPTIVRALIKIKLPTRVVVDFDLLSDEAKTKELYESLGGQWSEVKTDYTKVKSAIDNSPKPLNITDVITNLKEILCEIEEKKSIDKIHRKKIKEIIKESSAWWNAKKSGISIVPSGEARVAINSLISKFKEVGLWLVPCGELESFDKTISGKKSMRWVAKVLEKNISSTDDLKEAREFVLGLSAF